MNLQQLYYFRTIAEMEHYTKAATVLNVSQSRLSHAMNDLEDELQVTLFVRHGRNVKLTHSGEFLLRYVSESLNTLDTGLERLKDFVNPETGHIALSHVGSLSGFMPYLITRFFETTGKVGVHFQFNNTVTQNIEESLMAGDTDLAFTTLFSNNRSIDSLLIGTHKTKLVVSENHPLAKEHSVDLTKLGKEKFVTYSASCRIRSHIDEIFDKVGIHPEISFEGLYDYIVLGLVAANLGIALVPEAVPIAGLPIKMLDVENEIPSREIHMAWVKNRAMTPAVQAFAEFVRESGMILEEYKSHQEQK